MGKMQGLTDPGWTWRRRRAAPGPAPPALCSVHLLSLIQSLTMRYRMADHRCACGGVLQSGTAGGLFRRRQTLSYNCGDVTLASRSSCARNLLTLKSDRHDPFPHSVHQPELLGPQDGLGPARNTELDVDALRMALHGVQGNVQALGYFLVGQTSGDQLQHR